MLTGAGHDDVITHAVLLRTHADCTMAASTALVHHSFVMMGRAGTTVTVSHDLYEELLAAADRLSASHKQIVRARDADTQQSLTKAADDHEAMATLMDAGTAMSEDKRADVRLVLASLASLGKLTQNMDSHCARLCVPLSTLAPTAMADMSTVWHEQPDGAVSAVSGCGMRSFVKGAAGATRNVVLVYPRVSSCALAEYVKPADVRLWLWDETESSIDAHVTVERFADGGLKLMYAVAAYCVSELGVSVTVCGVAIGPDVIVQAGYDAINGTNHDVSCDVGTIDKTGMAVNAEGTMMAVSYEKPFTDVDVFHLIPSFERLSVIGRKGTGPAECKIPRRLCFTDDDTILVCDWDNNRVQQLTVAGEYLSSIAVQEPYSIAVYDDTVAVGTTVGTIEIHSLATGELIRRFGSPGDGPGQIGYWATGIRFTFDGSSLLVAEYRNCRLSLFTVDGIFVRHIGVGVLGDGWMDVTFGAGGDIIVADCDNHRICVFSPDGDTLMKTWGSEGTEDCQFHSPQALAVSGTYLYVMDRTRVQVFE